MRTRRLVGRGPEFWVANVPDDMDARAAHQEASAIAWLRVDPPPRVSFFVRSAPFGQRWLGMSGPDAHEALASDLAVLLVERGW